MSEIAAVPVEVQPISPPPSPSLVIAALVPPVLAGILLCFVDSPPLAWTISVLTIGITAAMVSIDSARLAKVDLSGKPRPSAALLFVGMCMLWVVGFPVAYFRRQRFGGPKLGFAALAVALFFGVVPVAVALMQPASLPECDSPDVVKLLDKVIRGTAIGPMTKTIDGYRELSFDPQTQIRQGERVAHTDVGDFPIQFNVTWQDRAKAMFEARLVRPDPPACDSEDAKKLLEQVIRGTSLGATTQSIDGHHDVSYDPKANVRHGECVAHTETGDVPVRFVVEWTDVAKGMFQVRTVVAE